MSNHQPILGKAPDENFAAYSEGKETRLSYAVVPVVKSGDNGDLIVIGTGFYVSHNGLFVTAKHVVDAAINEHGRWNGLALIHFCPGDTFFVRPVWTVARHEVADIALGAVYPMSHKITGEPLKNLKLGLSLKRPRLKSTVFTYAYPRTRVLPGNDGKKIIECKPGYFVGSLIEAHPSGRDKVMLPGDCFQTSMMIHSGASGGPVMLADGRDSKVIGVNSTGYDNDNLSYVTPIRAALDLPISQALLPGESSARIVTLRELCMRGLA
jgi:S1-C subfamily serine protease